jgi:hypothetical protein
MFPRPARRIPASAIHVSTSAAISAEDASSAAAPGRVAGVVATWRPLAIWIVVVAPLLALLFIQQAVLGRVPFSGVGTWKDLRIAIVHVLLAGYFPAAAAAVVQGAMRTHALIAPHLAGDQVDALRPAPPRLLTPGLVAAGIAGVIVGVIGPALTEPGRSVLSWWMPSAWAAEVWWHRVVSLPVGFAFGAYTWLLLDSSARLSRMSAHVRLDLFDLSPLAPITRQGLANGLGAMGPLALYGVISLNFGFTPMLAVVAGAALLMMTAALVLPLRGAHRQIVAAKEAEIAWCTATIDAERRAVRHEESTGAGGRFADLLAYETLVRRVPDWPFDTATLTRVALYSVIPIGSWIASTLVQHVVERYLFRH